MPEIILEGGWSVYLILLLALIGHGAGLLALFSGAMKQNRGLALGAGAAAIVVGVLTLLVGFVGYLDAAEKVRSALAVVDPGQEAVLRAVGERMAMIPLYFMAAASPLPILLGGFAVLKGKDLPD